MESITKAFWEGLSGKAKWDSVVSLRGPDLNNSGMIKMFTTSVVRYRLSGVMRVGGQISNLGCIIIPKGRLFKDEVFDEDHFFTHIREAAYHLDIPIVGVDANVYKAALDTSNVHSACAVFLRYFKEKELKVDENILTALEKGTKGYF